YGVTPECVERGHRAVAVTDEEPGAASVRRGRADDAIAVACAEDEWDRRLLLGIDAQLREHLGTVDDLEGDPVAAGRDVDHVRDRLVRAAERRDLVGRASLGVWLGDRSLEHRLPGPTHQPLVELRSHGSAIRARDEGEAPFWNRLEQRELTRHRPAVPDDPDPSDVAQEPGNADGVARGPARGLDCRLTHPPSELGRND